MSIGSQKALPNQLPKADLYLVSYGINPARDITLESLQLLRCSRGIYTILNSPILSSFLREHAIDFQDLTDMYAEGESRATIYRTIAGFVLRHALATPGICYLTYGHPMCFDEPVRLMLNGARKLKLSTYVSPAASFLDVILAFHRIPIGSTGLQLFDAASLVNGGIRMNDSLPAFVANIGAFNDDKAHGSSPVPFEHISTLVEYIRSFYSPSHMLFLFDSDHTGYKPVALQIPLCVLPLVSEGITYTTTLYIPPLRDP